MGSEKGTRLVLYLMRAMLKAYYAITRSCGAYIVIESRTNIIMVQLGSWWGYFVLLMNTGTLQSVTGDRHILCDRHFGTKRLGTTTRVPYTCLLVIT